MAQLLPQGKQQYFDNAGAPLAGGKLYTYESGTTTPKTTWADAEKVTANSNPIILDARGEAVVFWDGVYTAVLKTSADGDVWTVDGIATPEEAGSAAALKEDLASNVSGKGASLIGVEDAGGYFAGTTVEAVLRELVLSLYGDAIFVGDGSDQSTALQAWVDARKGKTLVIRNATFAGLILSGSTYNNTRLIVINHTLATRATAGTNNFGGAWIGLVIHSCDGVVLDYSGNGNRLVQPDEEHIYLVAVAGATNLTIPRFIGREIRGDGMYIGQENWFTSSAQSSNITIGQYTCYNSADDGRNALSVIAVSGMSVGAFQSYNVGGTVGGIGQPGGLDLEPNHDYQIVEDVSFGSVTVRAFGGSCVGIAGKVAGSGYNVRRINFGAVSSVNTRGAAATHGTFAVMLRWCQDVTVRGSATHVGNVGVAVYIDNAKRISTDIRVPSADIGVYLGAQSFVTESDNLRFNVSGYATCGIRAVGVTYSRIFGRVWGAASSSSTFHVQVRANSRAGLTQSRVTYSVDASSDGTNSRGYRNEPSDAVAFNTCSIQDCSVDGYSTWTTALDGFGVAGIRKRNVIGVTDVSVQPTDGGWTQGDFVSKFNPTKDANNMTVMGWVRLTTGTANVSGTDWAIANVSHVSPAA